MRYCFLALLFLVVGCGTSNSDSTKEIEAQSPEYAIVIHGGAGTITKSNLSTEKEKEYLEALNAALDIGEKILREGGDAIDAVQKTINFMEDSPLFNAGKGAVFAHNGTNDMDASIMDGATQNAGAVGGVTIIKNPINAARAVMEKSEHVFMVREGAEEFAKLNGVEIVDPSYFFTQRRFESLQRILKEEKTELSESDTEEKKHGTVGCVALDMKGNIVAGTSTGGMTNKKYNRIGDSPIIGAGTYADNTTCGVSSTGHGEFFIRYTVARDIAALMEYGGMSLDEAANYIINEKLVQKGGTGGVIALDIKGNIAMPFNTEGMYRGWAKTDKREVLIYK